jgi:hypothetical protein
MPAWHGSVLTDADVAAGAVAPTAAMIATNTATKRAITMQRTRILRTFGTRNRHDQKLQASQRAKS